MVSKLAIFTLLVLQSICGIYVIYKDLSKENQEGKGENNYSHDLEGGENLVSAPLALSSPLPFCGRPDLR